MVGDSKDDLLSTTERSLRIVNILKEKDGAGVAEITDEMDISKGAVYQHLGTLQENEYLVKQGGEYYPSLKFTNIGDYVRTRDEDYSEAVRLTESLSDKTGVGAAFIVKENGLGVYLRAATGETNDPMRGPKVGQRMFLHTIAAGKAILAHLSEWERKNVIEQRGLPKKTESTISDRSELMDELSRIRERGHAYNRGENIESVKAVGVAVKKSDGTLLGAVSVSGPEYHMDDEWMKNKLPRDIKSSVREYGFTI